MSRTMDRLREFTVHMVEYCTFTTVFIHELLKHFQLPRLRRDGHMAGHEQTDIYQ